MEKVFFELFVFENLKFKELKMEKRVGVPDKIYLKFRLITDRSEYGKLLTRDLKTMILEQYLKEECFMCIFCKEIIGIGVIRKTWVGISIESILFCGMDCLWKMYENKSSRELKVQRTLKGF